MSRPLRVLVAEDDLATRRAIVRALHSVEPALLIVECGDGRSAADRLEEGFDCVFLDYQLPGQDGLSVLREERSAGRRTAFILLTGQGDESLAVEAMHAGAADYLPKSKLSPERLAESLRHARRVLEAEGQTADALGRLRANEQRLSRIVEAIADGVLINDANGVYTFANAAAERMIGLPARAIIGRAYHDPPWTRIQFDGTPLPMNDHPLVKVMRTGRPATGIEFAVIRADGTRIVAAVSASPLVGPSGQLDGMVTTFRDITEAKEAEAALRRSEESLRASKEALRDTNERVAALIKAAPLGIVAMDVEGHVHTWNPAMERIFGWREQEAMGRPLPFVPPGLEEQAAALRARVMRGKTFTGMELRRQRKDGSMVDISLSTAVIRERSGRVVGILGMIEDITQAKRLKEQLLQAHRMETVGRLAGGVAHDFNNLLAVISGYTEALLRRVSDGPLLPYVQEIQKAADRGASVTRQLLAFSRRSGNQTHVVDLNHLVAGIRQMLRHMISEKITIDVRAETPSHVRVDPRQMEQVLTNLALNARDAMPDGGALTITVGRREIGEEAARPLDLRPGVYATMEVRDTGIGIDDELRQRIFEPFFTTKDGKGTGLGLSIVYEIVRQCGGRISVESQPGQGAAFRIILPLADEGEAESAAT